MDEEYKKKYLKYKLKYNELKKQLGGIFNNTVNDDIILAGYDKGNVNIDYLKKTKKFDVLTFLNNNIYWEKSGNISTEFTKKELNSIKIFFDYLWKNTSSSFIDNKTGKFASSYFLLDGNHRYPTTLHTESGKNELIKCEGFMWYNKIIQFIEINKNNNEYNAFSIDSANIRTEINKDIKQDEYNVLQADLYELLIKISKKFLIEDTNFFKDKCSDFTTNSNFLSNLKDPEIIKTAMKTSDDDIFFINDNCFIIKSKNLLYCDGKIMIIENMEFENDKIKYLKLKPPITQINTNAIYTPVLKKIFKVISTKLNKYLKKNVINVLPFGFYHIHIVKVKDEHKILLILHAAYEDNVAKDFNYNGHSFKKRMQENLNKNDIRDHNHIMIIDLDNIENMNLYSIRKNKINHINKTNKVLSFSIGDNFGFLKYSLFGSIIGHLSYFKDKDDSNPMNITLENQQSLKWNQQINIYEYIVGKLLVLLNFEKLSSDKSGKIFVENQFSRDTFFESYKTSDEWDILNEYSINKIKEFHEKDDDILFIYNEIEQLENEYLKCNICIKDKTACGHMIMQYFLYDPITIQTDYLIPHLYGGNYYKINNNIL